MSLDFLLTAVSVLMAVTLILFFYFRQKALLQFFQQEEYESGRFLHWVWDKKAFDIRTSLVTIVALYLDNVYLPKILNEQSDTLPYFHVTGVVLVYIIALVLGIMISRKTLKNSKKPLVMTMRAKRILGLSLVLAILSIAFANVFGLHQEGLLIMFQLPPLFLVVADMLLKPFEYRVKNKFLNEAKEKVRVLNPTIIGITGSYGKTSTKHILAHILGASAPTLATPGSVNTEMGVTRIIREQLEKRHKFFIVEMGAYGEGSIAKLCALAPPNLGIITGIGLAHLERFGDVDTIFKAKFELSQAASKNDGSTIINATRMPQHLLQQKLDANTEQFSILRTDNDGLRDAYIESIDADEHGLHFSLIEQVDGKDNKVKITAPVYGKHQAENIGLAIMAAKKLGVPMDTIQAALRNLPQTRHRLELFKSTQGAWVLDDAYNSNPQGFAEALKTLGTLAKAEVNGGKSILITPGMVELGTDHDKEHYEIGKLAGSIVDVAAVVTPERIPSFVKGFNETKTSPQELHEFESQEQAQTWVKALATKGDVILYENNLPDLFEAKVRF